MIYVKSKDEKLLEEVKDKAEEYHASSASKVRISFDLDPMNGY